MENVHSNLPLRGEPDAERINYRQMAPDSFKKLLDLDELASSSGLEKELLELIRLRASQINGCAFCLDYHGKEADRAGVSIARQRLLAAWRTAPVYNPRERAGLAWCEAVTLLPEGYVDDTVYEIARSHFSDKELVELTMALVTINAFNRLAVAFRRPVPLEPVGPGLAT